MKVPMQWIKSYTAIPMDAEAFQDAMIMHGTGVEGVEDQTADVKNVVVGRIMKVVPHENSDHMVICQVDVGEAEPVQIVTGAPNVHEGDEVPVALVGAELPGGVKIKTGKLRGVDSFGMCCSGPELGVPEYLYPSVGDKGLLVFHEEYAPGTDVHSILGIDDQIIDFEILANRPDCLSVWGVAREAAVTVGTKFEKPEIAFKTVPGRMSDYVTIDVRDTDLCPRYVGRIVRNVKIGPSPMWLRKALHGAGVRSINNIVDITNYVMLETGHPMHAFDLDKVKNGHIVVRRAYPDETITTLDGKERALTTDMLMIADETNATGIAGVMGGEESEITETTKTVLFEAAAFDRTSIRLTTRALGLRTEASGRFERGVCAATCLEAANRACQLVDMLDAGEIVDDVFDCYPNPKPQPRIEASVERINRKIGMEIAGEEMVDILQRLDMQASLSGDCLTVIPPVYREDIENESDISEEVLRIHGYEYIGSTLLRGETAPGSRNANMRVSDRVGRFLASKGFYEIRNFSFISPKSIEKLNLDADDPRRKLLALRNPLGEDTSVMRSTLIPSMLGTISLNQNRNNETAMLYEIGPVFDEWNRKAGELPAEIPTLSIGAYGEGVDFFLVRDAVLDLLASFGVRGEVVRGHENFLHPGRTAFVEAGGQRIAVIGELHPNTMKAFEITKRTVVAEVNLKMLGEMQVEVDKIKPLPKFPAVTRDLALVMTESTTVGSVLRVIEQAGKPILANVSVFDIYRGAPMMPGTKSVAFSLQFRNPDRTLSDDDVNPVMQKIIDECKAQCNAILRL
ncbi:MAG: phenylalanine--tRNA ligase subunit beta [Clostridia bacterium]|nr:phenylalanine--tRNA ligase subunit beta [Clostridia bacterium]